MNTRAYVAALAALPVSSVLFGIGAITVLSIPALNDHATTLIPTVVVASIVLTVPVAWWVSRRMMLRFWPRPQSTLQRIHD
jgi:uncharacterized membrane protein YdbT with pleckstrin-like domain